MKRLRIWLSNFTLIQQFLTIVFFTGAFLLFFVFTFLNRNIDAFVNSQMYVFIHRSQNEYLETRSFSSESNVLHFVYNTQSGRYLNSVSDQYELILRQIDPDPEGGKIDSSFESGNMTIVYSIISFGDNNENRLISIVKNNFRDEFRSALSNSIINITFYVFFALIGLIIIWVFSLIRPLDQIISYINKIKAGEKATLNVNRYDEIGEVAEALVSMNQELSEQQHIRDEMIQNISHDLKTPIATIKSYSESIKDGIYPYDTLEKSVDVIIENADRLEKKVYSLITYNKMGYLVDNNEGILNLEMAPLIQKAILAASVIRNDVKIITELDEKVLFHGDEEPWRVVIENLLDNALRYAKHKIVITLENNLLEVYNDGENIESDRLDKLFKPYEKGNKGKFGLGLSIVKKVVETYGYNITGENLNDGVVFRIYSSRKMQKAPKKKKKEAVKDKDIQKEKSIIES
ncbi:MAG: HAMP domain-containing histidine kinase [Erysipelotrichaceae bacterium]|nr:HAMP domain-containing histidine kinase [Erysipelotrichaceae bacterium]